MFLRQSTSQVIRFGPCLDIGDGVTEETALTLAQADMRLSKDGGAFAQKNAAGNATHDSDGWYSTTLDATDTATVGELILNVHQPANMLPVWQRYWVIEEAIYDLLYGAAADGLVTLAAVTHTGAVIPTVTTNSDMRGTDSAALASVCTEARLSELDEATAGKMANQVDIIQTDTTTDIPALLPAALVGGRMDSSVGAVATDAISAAGVSAGAANKVSDHTWRRTVANVEASSDGDTIGTSRGAYVVLAKHNNKCGVSGGTLTVYQDDDITSVITQTVTSDAAADPITDLDTV